MTTCTYTSLGGSCDYHVTVVQFMQDAEEVMDMLVKVQNEQGDMETDDPQVTAPLTVNMTHHMTVM